MLTMRIVSRETVRLFPTNVADLALVSLTTPGFFRHQGAGLLYGLHSNTGQLPDTSDGGGCGRRRVRNMPEARHRT